MRDKRFWIFLIFLFSGIIVGSLIGELTAGVPYLKWLSYGKSFGLTEPFVLDISILTVSLSFMIQLNIASIIGIVLAVVLYKLVK